MKRGRGKQSTQPPDFRVFSLTGEIDDFHNRQQSARDTVAKGLQPPHPSTASSLSASEEHSDERTGRRLSGTE
ncbi:hypothetical protein ACFFQF_05255 [Haladaptatus pallidirubidus]|uniref:hypothetical protein n=1 Tax=Haladaptatus pallidirubidus TaxID=1008152 RepID=UPI001D12A107|nr:hypothetical protein [Haladaptatus pallidirubidus]